MAFNPYEFYTEANNLHSRASADGGALRTLISRAYYGALIVARDAKGLSSYGENGHNNVIKSYGGNEQEDMVSDTLKKLKSAREKADYMPKTNLTKADGLQALSGCKRVLTALNAMPPKASPPSAAATP